jgi:hypothetical protein
MNVPGGKSGIYHEQNKGYKLRLVEFTKISGTPLRWEHVSPERNWEGHEKLKKNSAI